MLNYGFGKIHLKVLIATGLAAAVLLVYGQTGQFDFIHSYDDREYVVDNPHIRQGITIRAVGWAFTTFYAANWHPVTWLSHMLDAELYGLDPGGHHLTNVILHLINTLLLFHLLQRMTAATWRSAAVAALFALHPLHVESVAMVAERKDVLSTFFWIATLQCYITYASRASRRWYGLTLGCFALGLLAKPMVVTLPFVLLLLDFWPLQRWGHITESSGSTSSRPVGLIPLVLEKFPFFLLSAGAGVVTILAQHSKGATGSMAVYPIFHRLANALVSYATYLVKTIWPHPLVVFYPYRDSISAWQWLASAGLLAALTTAVLVYGRKKRYLICGWLWYLVTLLPVIGLVQVGAQSMADRYTYIPLIGIFIMAVWVLHEITLHLQLKTKLIATAGLGYLLVLGVLSWTQIGYWADSIRLFEHATTHSADNWVAHNNLGSALARNGQADAALAHYQTALEIAPGYADARYNLGVTLSGLGRHDEAIRQYRQVLSVSPEHAGALNNLCGELIAAEKIQEGIAFCLQAVAIAPGFANPHNNLAAAMTKTGRGSEAIDHYRQALALDSDNPEAHLSLGKLLVANGRVAEARQHFYKALQLDPDNEPYCRQAADTLMRSGYAGAAAEFYSAALRRKPGSADTYNSLGVALARSGLPNDAAIMFQEALRKDPGHTAAAGNLQRALSGK